MNCVQCKQPILGAAYVAHGEVVHEDCRRAFDNAKQGRPHSCPKCKTQGEVNDPTRTRTIDVPLAAGETPDCAYNGCMGCYYCSRKRVTVPVRVPCDLCGGHGFTASEAKPVTRVVVDRWEF